MNLVFDWTQALSNKRITNLYRHDSNQKIVGHVFTYGGSEWYWWAADFAGDEGFKLKDRSIAPSKEEAMIACDLSLKKFGWILVNKKINVMI